jgi:trimeric autotransporter adhesin
MALNHRKLAGLLISACLIASGCSDSDSGIPFGGDSGNTNNPITAPTAGNISFSVLGGSATTASAANGILSVGNPNTATVVNVQSPTTRGGSVVANADGSFTYNAPALGNTTDTFSYTIQNAGGNSTGTATVTLLGRGFFVNNQAAAGGTGTQQAPFQNLAQVQAAAAGVNGAEIVVFQGDGTNSGYNTAFALGANQTLRGFSQAATPLLTGPVSFSSGNKLEDVRISGTPGTASAVNAVGASGGTINRVSISNLSGSSTALAGNLTDATGAWLISNCNITNVSNGFASLSTVGNLNWGVTNTTFTNATFCSVCEQPSGAALQNLTVSGCSITGGTSSGLAVIASTNGTTVGLNVNNCTVNGGGTAVRGVDVSVQGTTALTGIFGGNNVTGCTGEGVQFGASGNSTARVKFSGNRTIGNRPTFDFSVGAVNNANICMVCQNNTAVQFGFGQNQNSTISVEQLATFTTRNTGSLNIIGTITDVVAGFCGLP